MGIRKVGNRWKLEYRPKNAQPIYENFATKTEATHRLRELKSQRKQMAVPTTYRKTLADAIDKFIIEIYPYCKNDKKVVYRFKRLEIPLNASAPVKKTM